MASRSVQAGRFVQPPRSPSSSASASQQHDGPRLKTRKRDANVFDAVSGRVTTTHALEDDIDNSGTQFQRLQRASTREATLAPEEVLFRRVGAPVRFAEKDIYFAHEDLPNYGRHHLPDSDMLKSIHNYTSQFYSALAVGTHGKSNKGVKQARTTIDEQSMDETALLALGILLEESGREILGRRGDLVFTEGAEPDLGELLSDRE